MIIIGSKALVNHGLLQPGRKIADTDYLCTLAEYEGFCSVFKEYDLIVNKEKHNPKSLIDKM